MNHLPYVAVLATTILSSTADVAAPRMGNSLPAAYEESRRTGRPVFFYVFDSR